MEIFVEVIINSFCNRVNGQVVGYTVCFTPIDSPGGEMRPISVGDLDQLQVLLRSAGAEDKIPEIIEQLDTSGMSIVAAALKSEVLAFHN